MAEFDKTNLKSVLAFIKKEYGIKCFKDGKVTEIMDELAPNLKKEKSLLQKLCDKGLMKEIAENTSANEYAKQRIINKSLSFLVDEELIQQQPATEHLNVLSEVFGYNTLPVGLQDVNSKSAGNSENIASVIKASIGLELITCSAGNFMMGNPDPDEMEILAEVQHKVILTKSFMIGKFPVTQAQYNAIEGRNPSTFKGFSNPVDDVNWHEAVEFCEKLNKKFAKYLPSGYRFDLPTEAQWEYACRAGTETALNNDKDLTSENGKCPNLDEVAWYFSNSDRKTHIVGMKKPNAWGICDMHGNIWEWCKDWRGEYPAFEVTDPVGPCNGSDRILRGGCWFSHAKFCRSSFRYSCRPDFRNCSLGFRVALVPVQ